MPRTRHLTRRTARSPTRRAGRALTRSAVRSLPGHRRGPDDLSSALVAFRRAIRCHRRFAKLAPRFFDSTVVDREARERGERRRWMESWQPLLDKVYGPSRDPEQRPREPTDYPPPLPGPRTQQAVERELAGWNVWMALGRLAMARHQQRRPHATPSFSHLARLLEIAFDFGRLATGIAPGLPDPASDNHDAAWADLKRAYGHRCGSASSDPGSPPAPAAQAANPAPASPPVQSVPAIPSGDIHPANATSRSPPADLAPCPAAPSQLEPRRSDAWSRWARHVRRLRG